MESILETLYTLAEPIRDTPQEREALCIFRDMLEKSCPEEAEQIWNRAMDICRLGQQEIFRRGFRLGMQTAVEGLQDIGDVEPL